MKNPVRLGNIIALAILAGGVCFLGCEKKNEYVAPPPPQVTVAQPVSKDVTNYADFTGTTRAIESVELRARVKGFLEKINFEPGASVKQGDLLFVIDPKPFKAALDQANAELEAKKADLDRARIEYRRNQRLMAKNAASERQLVETKAAQEMGEAALAAAKAQVEEAQLNLGYTHITAPISGVITRTRVDVGNLVGAGENTLLATIYKIDPIYAYFNASEREILEFLEQKEPKKEADSNEARTVYLGLASESGYPHQGRVDYADPYVDPDTGTVQIRGVFPNPDTKILPGMFVRVRVPTGETKDALLVTDRALGSDQSGKFLLKVNDDNVVVQVPVETGALVDGMRVIIKGIGPDDWVIVSGLQRARPGVKVAPQKEDSSSKTAKGDSKTTSQSAEKSTKQ